MASAVTKRCAQTPDGEAGHLCSPGCTASLPRVVVRPLTGRATATPEAGADAKTFGSRRVSDRSGHHLRGVPRHTVAASVSTPRRQLKCGPGNTARGAAPRAPTGAETRVRANLQRFAPPPVTHRRTTVTATAARSATCARRLERPPLARGRGTRPSDGPQPNMDGFFGRVCSQARQRFRGSSHEPASWPSTLTERSGAPRTRSASSSG